MDDLDAYLAELTSRGGRASEPTLPDGRIRVAYRRDPERNLPEPQQWLATRADPAGQAETTRPSSRHGSVGG